jgi:hypothetical protein
MLGDEEMMDYIRRQHARKMAGGAKKEDLDELLKFPEPIPPAPGLTPQGELLHAQPILYAKLTAISSRVEKQSSCLPLRL